VGPAHDEAELEALKAAAQQPIAAWPLELDFKDHRAGQQARQPAGS
jgi:hypothetical protein